MSANQEEKDNPFEKWTEDISRNFRRGTHRANKHKERHSPF